MSKESSQRGLRSRLYSTGSPGTGKQRGVCGGVVVQAHHGASAQWAGFTHVAFLLWRLGTFSWKGHVLLAPSPSHLRKPVAAKLSATPKDTAVGDNSVLNWRPWCGRQMSLPLSPGPLEGRKWHHQTLVLPLTTSVALSFSFPTCQMQDCWGIAKIEGKDCAEPTSVQKRILRR